VQVFDPNTKESFGGMNISDIWTSIPKSEVLVILTDHDEFRKLDLKEIGKCVKENTILVVTRRIFNRTDVENLGIKYVSIGCSIGSKHK